MADVPALRRTCRGFNDALKEYQNLWKQLFVNSEVREHPHRGLVERWVLDRPEGRHYLTINYCSLLKSPYQEGDPEFEKIKNDTPLLIDFYLCAKHKTTFPSEIYLEKIHLPADKVTQWEEKEYAFAINLLKKQEIQRESWIKKENYISETWSLPFYPIY